jgi:hypothetical protein
VNLEVDLSSVGCPDDRLGVRGVRQGLSTPVRAGG